MGRKKKQEGPGRPQWVTRRDEVRLSLDDEARLEWWQHACGEPEKGRAYRRALVVLHKLAERRPYDGITEALDATEGVLK